MRALPASLAVFCLQYCPVHNTLYACAGMRSPAVPVVAEKPAKGAPAAAAAPVASSEDTVKDTFWAIDKVIYYFPASNLTRLTKLMIFYCHSQ